MKKTSRLAAAALAAAVAFPGLVAAADDAPVASVAFESLDVSVANGVISVTGSATFGGEELVVGVDDALDGGLAGVGTDITELRVSQDPKSGVLEFAMDIDLQGGATTPTFAWSLPFGGSDLSGPQLLAFANDATGVPGSFTFKLGTGGGIAGADGGDFSVADANGRLEGSTLIWSIDPSAAGLAPGKFITEGAAPAYTAPGGANAGVTFIGGNRLDEANVTDSFAVGGGARVEVKDASGEVVEDGIAKVRRGTFSIAFDDLAPGKYTVEVTSAYADASVMKSFKVTVA